MRLVNMSVSNHDFFGNISFPLSSGENHENSGTNYKTVIIGANGTGKSTILACIADALTIECSERKKRAASTVRYDYELNTSSHGKNFSLRRNNLVNEVNFIKGKILALCSTPNDRFPFLAKNSIRRSEKYDYLGMKSASNNIFFSSVKERMLQDILKICASTVRVRSALKVLEELNFDSKFSLQLEKGSNFLLFQRSEKLNPTAGSQRSFQSATVPNFLKSPFYKENKAAISTLLLDNTIEKVEISFLANLKTIRRHADLMQRFAIIVELVEAKILSVSSLSIFSNGSIDMHQSSSGEFNILRILLSVISRVENDSIILIDEPEVSLHPNWQISFLSLLDSALSNFHRCHSVIATHSHFIISNLDSDNSSILTMRHRAESSEISVEEMEVDSYGWSPEQTLYRVFGVTGFRNKYLELDLRILIDYMSNGVGNRANFKAALARISKFNIMETDPLFKLLKNANKILVAK